MRTRTHTGVGVGGEGVKKLLLLIKNEELVHIDRT